MRGLRRLWRLPALVALLLGGLLFQLAAFRLIGARGRERAIRRWSRMLLGACGVRVQACAGDAPAARPRAADVQADGFRAVGRRTDGPRADGPDAGGQPPATVPGGCLLVANHLSWLDIFVIDTFAPAQFVAKAEIRGWPVIGALVALAGTHFIERHRRHAVRDVIGKMAAALRDGRRVAVFPEGGIGDGSAPMRFHANLLQAAVEAGTPVVPVALRYLDAAGRPSQAALYAGGTTFVSSLWRIIGEPCTVVQAAVLPALPAGAAPTRHALAARAERAVREALGLPASMRSGP